MTRLVRWWVPWAIVLVLLAAVARTAARPIINADTYFHLRFGREFIERWSLRDPGSITPYATEDWVPTQWLPQVVMAWASETFGLWAVAWLAGAVAIVFAVAVYLVSRMRADAPPAAAVTALTVLASWPFLSGRPQVLSYLFVVVSVGLWTRARESGRPPWLLVPLVWLWAMCHGMWPVGLVLGCAFVVGLALERTPIRQLRGHLVVVGLAAVVPAATPVGPRVYGAVTAVGERSHYFSEWGPTDFTSISGLAVVALLAPAFLVMLRHGPNRWTDVLLLGLATGWALYSLRTVPVGAAMGAPVAAAALQRLIGPPAAPRIVDRAVVAGGALASLGLLAALTTTQPMAPTQPAWVDPALSQLPAGTPVLSDWVTGGYLMWRYPHLDLVTHGYADTFTLEELERNSDIRDVEPGWDDLVRQTGARHALLPPDAPLAYALVEQTGWHVVHSSEEIRLLVAPEDWTGAPTLLR
ncbi:hypothetical protein [Nocardioides sp. SYSU DS0663]|uniref:hypothetical protein n=1 Tax=Nocardioides sp. SYSU DS0663 TaxID=3416445 RepID=UPI003F4B6F4C